MVDGDPGFDIWGMDVARYGDWATRTYTNAKVRENYSRRFRIRFPNEELPAGRPLQTTPLYDTFIAQGAVMALEDAATLGTCIARQPETAKALRQYEALRQPRTARVAAMSGGLARIYHAKGFLKFARDCVLRMSPPGLTLARMGKLYDWRLPD